MLPITPTGVNLTAGANRIFVNWNPVADALYYRVYHAATFEGPFTLLADNIYDLNYGHGGITGQHFYTVEAVGAEGDSPQSYPVGLELTGEETEINPGGVNLNTANILEVMQVSGVGFEMGTHIVKHRPYSSIAELMGVCGMTVSRYEIISKNFTL